jgi:hypothetical protein
VSFVSEGNEATICDERKKRSMDQQANRRGSRTKSRFGEEKEGEEGRRTGISSVERIVGRKRGVSPDKVPSLEPHRGASSPA